MSDNRNSSTPNGHHDRYAELADMLADTSGDLRQIIEDVQRTGSGWTLTTRNKLSGRNRQYVSPDAYFTGFAPSEYGGGVDPVNLDYIEAIANFEAENPQPGALDAPGSYTGPAASLTEVSSLTEVVFIDAGTDGERLDWPGEWAHHEEGRIWLPNGAGEYALLAGLPGRGKSHLAQELAAREREAGGHPLAIVCEAVNSWRHRNRQLPPGARVDIVAGVPDLVGLRQVLKGRLLDGHSWPSLVVVDPATLAVGQWADSHRDGAVYSYPVVSRAVANLQEALDAPIPPRLILTVHTPETEQGGRNVRAVGGYSQGAGVAYLLPALGKVSVLKAPRDCPQELPSKPMLYTLEAGRITYVGLAVRNQEQAAARIVEFIAEAGTWGRTARQIRDTLTGVGRVTVTTAIPRLIEEGKITETTSRGIAGADVVSYRLAGLKADPVPDPVSDVPLTDRPFRMPDEPAF